MDAESERRLRGNKVISPSDPPVSIRIDRSLLPLGRVSFTLSGVADVELFGFLQGEAQQAERLLAIQFEQFRDGNAYVYDYPMAQPIEIGGLPFMTDVMQLSFISPAPDSDVGQLLGLVQARGYHLPAFAIVQRFMHTVGQKRRKELLIVYAEAALPGGSRLPNDPAAHQAFQKRALASFRLKPGPTSA